MADVIAPIMRFSDYYNIDLEKHSLKKEQMRRIILYLEVVKAEFNEFGRDYR